MTLPAGWTVDEETQDQAQHSALPPGWTIDATPSTAKERDEAKLKKAAGSYHVPNISDEELSKMSPGDRYDYLKRAEIEGRALGYGQMFKGLLSGATFGLTENVEALKPVKFEEVNPYSVGATTGELAGSFIPLSGLIKVFSGPATKLAAKSPILQKQLSSLGTMFGVGVAEEALHKVAQGEMPSADEVLQNGAKWALLDGILQTAGAGYNFAKGLFSRSKSLGIPRKDIVTGIAEEALQEATTPEAVAQKAMELLEGPMTQYETTVARKLKTSKPAPTPVEEVAQNVLKEPPVTPVDLKTKQIQPSNINRLNEEAVTIAEPYELKARDFTHEAEALEKDAIQSKIDAIGERAASEEELGQAIQKDIEAQLASRKSEYRPLYREAEEESANLVHVPTQAAREAGDKLIRMSKLATKPQGYANVLRNLENVLTDAGFVIQRNEAGAIEHILSEAEVPVSDTIELARRLNEMIDYEAVEPTVKDALRSVVRGAKQDIRAGLAAAPDALAAFELAEAAHAQTASRYSTDTIRKIRGNEAGEKVSKMAESPSTLGALRETLSPEQMLQVEREMLEKLNTKNYSQAKKTYQNIQHQLSKENRKLAREIVEAKNPHNPTARRKLIQESILDDMSNALTTGARPKKTLDLWQTPEGKKLVKQTFKDSPNWPQVKKYLETQSFNDMAASVLKNGHLDIAKFKEFMRDPLTLSNIREVGGEEAVQFFKDMSSRVRSFENNAKLLEMLPKKSDLQRGKELLQRTKEKAAQKPTVQKLGEEALETTRARAKETTGVRGKKILERMVQSDFPTLAKVAKWVDLIKETLNIPEKTALTVFGLMKLGVPNTVVSLVGYRLMNRMLTSPRMRRAFIEASKHHTNPLTFILAIEALGDIMHEGT